MLCTICLILGYGSNFFKYHIDNESLKSNKPDSKKKMINCANTYYLKSDNIYLYIPYNN